MPDHVLHKQAIVSLGDRYPIGDKCEKSGPDSGGRLLAAQRAATGTSTSQCD